MTSKKVTNPTQKSNAGFIWAIVALVVIAAAVIGYIVIQGRSGKAEEFAKYKESINAELVYENNLITLVKDDSAPEGTVYEDFSCGYCAQLAVATDQQMKDAVEAGELKAHIAPLNFLDNDNLDGHSTNALAATLTLADKGEKDAFWSLRKLLMEEQQNVYGWDKDDFANAAAALDASSEAVQAIRNGDYIEEANKVASANAQTLEDKTGTLSSPRVFIGDEELEPAKLQEWVTVATSR